MQCKMVDNVFQEPNYNNETTFNSAVTTLFNNFSGTSGTVTSIVSGVGISCNPDPITSSGTIALNAVLNNLNDVNISSPVTNEALIWNGTSWVNTLMSGTSPASFIALSDVDIPSLSGLNNNLIVVNSTGTSISSITNDYKNSIIAGNGINVIESTNSARIILDVDSLLENFTSDISDYYVIEDSNGDTRRIRQSNINISNFNNDSNYINLNNLTVTSPLTYNISGTSLGTFGLCTSAFDAVDFNNGVSGILPITHGGTSGSTSIEARENLGLVYNVDILSQSGPSFDQTLFGDNIFLQPSFFEISIGASGSGYSTGSVLLTLSPYDNIPIEITVDGAGGISGFTATEGGSSYLARGNFPDTTETWSVTGGGGSGASFSVVPEINYINFGVSTGDDGIGFRNNQNVIEVKSRDGASWQAIFPITVDNLDDVITTGVSSGDVLIYNGTSWVANDISGFINIASNGVTSYAGGDGGISPASIQSGSSSITVSEFGTLTGMNAALGTIQEQLNEKVGTSNVAPSFGDIIYWSETGVSSWQPLSIGASRQILNTGDGTSIPEYSYLHDIMVVSSSSGVSPPGINVPVMSINSPDLSVPMYSILDDFTSGSSNGIDMASTNDVLQLNLNNLPSGSNLSSNDELGYYRNISSQTQKITVENFCDQISGQGLSANGSVINLAQPLPLGAYDFGTSPTAGLTTGNLAYFSDGDSGNPCLGVYLGTCWHIVQIGNPISS